MKHTYLLVDSKQELRERTPIFPVIEVSNKIYKVSPVIEVSNRIYKKAKELLTLNQYDFSETTNERNGVRIHRVKLNEPMTCSLAQFILENL